MPPKKSGSKGKTGGKKGAAPIKVEKAVWSTQESHKRIWRSLYVVQRFLESHEEPTPEEIEQAATSEDEELIAKVTQFTPDELLVPWNQMRDLVLCCVMATHGNPTAEDAEERVEAEIGTMENPTQENFSKADVEVFVDSVMGKWFQHYEVPKQNGPARREAIRAFLQELAENITEDEPPNQLLDSSKVLMICQVTENPTLLSNPVDTFITLPPPKLYPPIFDLLWNRLCDGARQSTLTVAQFRVFFTWFYLLHFNEVTVARAEAAALSAHYQWLDQKGEMTKECFQLAASDICRRMARQRDTIEYFTKCVKVTEEANKAHGVPNSGILFFQSPQHVGSEVCPRRTEYDPNQLYIPPEIRRWQQDKEEYEQPVSRNRIIVHGARFVGKTKAGRALANALKCIHLDVFDLALTALKKDTTLGKKIKEHFDSDTPIPLELQSALIRQEVCSQKAEYYGYVLSDSLLYTEGTSEALTKFMEDSGVVSECIPTIFLEVTCEPSALPQHASRLEVELEDKFRAEAERRSEEKRLAIEQKEREERRDALDALQQELQEKIDAIEPPEDPDTVNEELMDLQQELDGVREELDYINQKIVEEMGRRAELESGEAADLEKRKNDQDEAYLHNLIYLGRRALIKDQRPVLPLTSLPCFKRIIDVAKAANHSEIYSVNGISKEEDIARYLMNAASLRTPLLPIEPPLEDVRVPASVDGDNQLGRLKEQAAEGAEPSHTWKRFCPVTYMEEVLLIEGSPCYSCIYEGRFYCMASESKLHKFISNPHHYLRQKPVHRYQMFLIADSRLTKSNRINLPSFSDKIASSFMLNRMTFEKYYSGLQERREQQQRREGVYLQRTEYEKEERELREQRYVKRYLAEQKLKKKAPKKPKVKKEKGKKGTPAAEEEPAAESQKEEEVEEEVYVPERLQDVIEAGIQKAKEERRNAVPVLLELLEGHVNLKSLELLMNEGVLPENIVFLQSVLPDGTVEEVATPEPDTPDMQEETIAAEPEEAAKSLTPLDDEVRESATEETPAKEEVEGAEAKKGPEEEAAEEEEEAQEEVDTIEVCLEQLSQPRKEWKLPPGAISQNYAVTKLNIFGKTEDELVQELEMLMNPGIATVEQGMVDEELGADADEEEEDEEEDEDEDEDFPAKPLAKIEKELRPVRRFLHQFGSRLQFCPVSLIERGLLVKGKNEYCVKYLDELYCFVSEEYKTLFQQNPLHYIGAVPPRTIPPRFWMIGGPHIGKKMLASGLQEAYGIPYFKYTRKFLEDCIEAAESPNGGHVEGIFIPHQTSANPYLERGSKLLKEVREFAESQALKMKQREEAEEIMAQREEREELSSGEDEEEEAPVDEELEERLREWLEFEPEDEEDKLVRLNEAYLRIAGCVSRLEPFETKGYIMIFPPVAEADLDFIFEEGGIPELVIDVQVTPEVQQERSKPFNKDPEEEEAKKAEEGSSAKAEMSDKEWDKLCRRKERELRKWRRRHIGANDAATDEEREEDENENANEDNEPQDEAAEQDPEDLLDEFLEGLEDRRIKVLKVRNDLEPGAALNGAKERLAPYLENRLSYFCAPQVVFYDDAVKMLASGKARLSIFDRSDPVNMYGHARGERRRNVWKENGLAMMEEAPEVKKVKTDSEDLDGEDEEEPAMMQQQDAGDDEEMSELESGDLEEMRERLDRRRMRIWRREAPRTVLLYGNIYFFETDETVKKFLVNPLKYMEQAPPLPNMKQSPIISLYEDDVFFQDESDGEKKRGIAETMAKNLGYFFISIPKLLSWAALNPILGDLCSRAIKAALTSHVDEDLIEKLLVVRLGTAEVKDRGAVLLNLPRTVQQYQALLANGCAPVVKVSGVGLEGPRSEASQLKEWATPVIQAMKEYGLVDLPVAVNGEPWSNANLNEAVRHVDEFVDHQREAILRGRRAYPINVENTYHSWSYILNNLSEYQWYCPYCWVNHSDLVYVRNHTPQLAATYLGKYYFFSHPSYLVRFLKNPAEVADPTKMRPLPPHLPEPVNGITSRDELEFQGCCPVVLYDTRENKGLRGVPEPRATVGSLDFVVRYAGKLYALLNRENRTRFLMCPWQYVDGSFMPPRRKCPLTPDEVQNGISDQYFIRRRMYDSVAYAMLAVAAVRPQYPGLTIEESALKYIALHMKATNEANNDIQAEQYKNNLKIYESRSTLYKGFKEVNVDEESHRERVDELCEIYDRMIQIQNRLDTLGRLKTNEAHSNVTMLVEGVKSTSLSIQNPTAMINATFPQSHRTSVRSEALTSQSSTGRK